jgi:MFS family permease
MDTLTALRYRDYRYLTVSSFLWFAVRWIEVIVVGWLVLETTNSPFLVGLVGAVRFAGWLLTPFAGVIADRISRRNLLLYSQAIGVLLAVAFLILLLAERLEVWHIIGLTLLRGVNIALDFPVRNALVVDLVPPKEQLNAVSLNRAASDVTSAFGPVTAGFFIVLFSYAGAFWLILILSVVNLFFVFFMRDFPGPGERSRDTIWSSFKEGLQVCRRDGAMMGVLGLAGVANMFGYPLIYALLPVFAKQVLRVGAAQLGLLAGAVGIGALIGSLCLAWKGSRIGGNRLLWISFLFWFAITMLFAIVPHFYLSLLLLMAMGGVQAVAMITTMAFLLHRATPEMRGCVMGFRGLAIIPLFGGNLIGGALTGWLGAPTALVIFGLAGILCTVAIGLRQPVLRR